MNRVFSALYQGVLASHPGAAAAGNDANPFWFNGVAAANRSYTTGELLKFSDGNRGVANGVGVVTLQSSATVNNVGALMRCTSTSIGQAATVIENLAATGIGIGHGFVVSCASRPSLVIARMFFGNGVNPFLTFDTVNRVFFNETTSGQYRVADIAAQTDLRSACVKGGFTTSGLPILPGDATTNYNAGTFAYLKATGGAWTLVAIGLDASAISGVDGARGGVDCNSNGTVDYRELRRYATGIPRELVQSLVMDEFTDANGTALAAHTPNRGSTWSMASGSMTIEGNAVQGTPGVTAQSHIGLIAGDATPFIQGMVVYDSDASRSSGLVLSAVDANNYFRVELSGGQLRVVEVTGGAENVRANLTVAGITNGTAYLVRAWRGPDGIRADVRTTGTTHVTTAVYATTVRNTATLCGVYCQTSSAFGQGSAAVQHFHLWQRSSTAISAMLDALFTVN